MKRLVPLLVLLAGCGGGEDPRAEEEFQRHLRQGLEQMRRLLPASARAELEKCAELRPDDPEVLFHTARLELMGIDRLAGEAAARELLALILADDPDHAATHRLLFELDGADEHRRAFERVLGQVGQLELAVMRSLMSGAPIVFPVPDAPTAMGPFAADYRALREALERLERDGAYDPNAAVPALEAALREQRDLAALRLYYAGVLIEGEVRIQNDARPDLPPMSSMLILDMAWSHLERAYDLANPSGQLATNALIQLSGVAERMGDYDEAVAIKAALLDNDRVPGWRRPVMLSRQGLGRYKQGRFPEAVGFIDEAFAAPPVAGFGRPPRDNLSMLWLAHVLYDAAGVPPERRAARFPFRRDLVRSPDGPLLFEDVAPALGIDKLDGLGPSAWADYDRDGDFDLFVCGCDSYGALYRNDGENGGGGFADVSREAGLFHVQSGYSATFCDYDDDGWPDLYIGRDGWNGPAANSLYRNDGEGAFADVTAQAGVGHGGSSFVHAWSDVDRDGDVDLYVANGIVGGGDTNVLYRNEGDGTFQVATVAAGLAEKPGTKTIGLAFGDYDDDGWPDLFVSGYQTINRLYRNRGDGTFEERAKEAGVLGPGDPRKNGYVCFFLDYDGDLDLDILKTNLAPWGLVLIGLSERFDTMAPQLLQTNRLHMPELYRNDGDGTFTDVAWEAGLRHPMGVMGAGVADLDNDGWLDLYFGTGAPDIGRLEPDRFYRANGDGTFTDLTFVVGLGNLGKGHGVTFLDHDGDGDLEVYVPEGGFVHGDPFPNAFYANNAAAANHWLHVDLEGDKSNRGAIGARLIVHAGGRGFLREIGNGEGFGSSNTPTVEFGLGQAEEIERLEIRWPSGAAQTFDDVPIDARIFVREGEGWVRR
ncbi:MAG: FG-GAP-like repeat-containing protein [Planctomycetota bacterium]|nr:FG-GAP-like repeat-containing protein [Planctomycetota bacterium]